MIFVMKDKILHHGMAIAQGDLLVGINAVGIPIFNAHRSMEFCIVALDSEMFLPYIKTVKNSNCLNAKSLQSINLFKRDKYLQKKSQE
jgi:hypothetical protein